MLRLQIANSLVLSLILLALCYNIQTAPTHHLTIGVQGNTPTLMVTSSEIGITTENMGSLKKPEYKEKSHKHLDAKKKWDKVKLIKNSAALNKKDKLQHLTKPLIKQTSLEVNDDIQHNLETTPVTLKSLRKDQEIKDFKTTTTTTTNSKLSALENSEVFTTNKELSTLDFKEINNEPLITTQIAHETTTPKDSLYLKTMTTTLKPKYVNIPSTMSANLNPKDLNDILTTTAINYPDEENPNTTAFSNDFTKTQTETQVNKNDNNEDVMLFADVSQTEILQDTTQNENDNDSYTTDPVAVTANNKNLLLSSVETKAFTNTPIASTAVDISTDSTPSYTPNTLKENNAIAAQQRQDLSLSSLTITSEMRMETPMTTTENIVVDNDKMDNGNQQKLATEFAEIDKTTESLEGNINKGTEQRDNVGNLGNYETNTEYSIEATIMPKVYEAEKPSEKTNRDKNKATTTQKPQFSVTFSKAKENKMEIIATNTEIDSHATTTAKTSELLLESDVTTKSGQSTAKFDEASSEAKTSEVTKIPESFQETHTTTESPKTYILAKTTPTQNDETSLEPETTTEAVLKLIDLEQHVLKTIDDLKQPSLLMSAQHDNGHDGLKNIKKKQLVDKHYVEALLHNKQDSLQNEKYFPPTTQGIETTSVNPATIFTTNKPLLMPVKHGYLGPILMEEKTFHVIHHADKGETNKKHHVADIEDELRKHHFVELKVKTEVTESPQQSKGIVKNSKTTKQLENIHELRAKDSAKSIEPDEQEMQSDQPAPEPEKPMQVKSKYRKFEQMKHNAKFQSKFFNKEMKNFKAAKGTQSLSSEKVLEPEIFSTTKEIIEPTEHSPIDLNEDIKTPTGFSKTEEVNTKTTKEYIKPLMVFTTTETFNKEIGQTIGLKDSVKSSIKTSNLEKVTEKSYTETITEKNEEVTKFPNEYFITETSSTKEIAKDSDLKKVIETVTDNSKSQTDFSQEIVKPTDFKEDFLTTTGILKSDTSLRTEIGKSNDLKEVSKSYIEKLDKSSTEMFKIETTTANMLPNSPMILNETKNVAENPPQTDRKNKSSTVLSTTVFQVMDTVATKTPIVQADTLFTSEDNENPIAVASNPKEQTESKISDIQIEVYDSTIDSIVASTNFKDAENKKHNFDESSLGKTTKPPVAAIQQERFTQYVIDRAETSTHEPINYSTIQVASGKPEPAAIEIHINVSESFGNESEDLEFSYPQSEYNNNNERIGELLYEDSKVNDNIKLKIPSNSNNNGKDLRNDEILVVEIIDTDNITDASFKEKNKTTDDLFITDSKDHEATPPPPPPPPPYQNNFDRDSDTIFYISNTEVKVGESLPDSKNDNEERKLKLESQFFPANYIASTHPNINNREDSNNNHHVYEEDIILSSSHNQADSLKIYRNRNEPSPPLDVTYVGESIIEVEQSPDSVLTTTYVPDQQHYSGTPQADVIIQPAILPEISIGVPVIGELPPQIELKEIDFMPNEAQLHRSGIYEDNDIDDNTINGGSNSNHEADIANGNNNNINQRVDESSIQYGGDLIDESADGGFDGVEGSYPFGNPAAIGKSSSSPYTSAFMAKLRKQQQQQQPNHVADYAHLYVNYGVNNMRKDELSADVKDSGETMLVGSSGGNSNIASNEQNITNFKDFLLNNSNKVSMNNSNLLAFMSANLTQNERMSNATAFSVMEDANDLEDKNAEDIINLISLAIGLFIVILPVVVTCSLFWALRYLYIKYHSNVTDNGGYADQTEIKVPLDEDGVEKGEDISRVARETKMDYNKDGVFVVEVARGIDSKTIPESPVTEGSEKMLSMFDTKQNNGGIGYKITNEKNCVNNEKVQIHSPPPENSEEGPRSLHQIEEVEEPTNSPQLNENSNDEEVIGLAYKANTGLSQSDLSTTSSNDSNKGYCYGNQELYVVEQSGYASASPVSNVVLKCDVKDINNDDRNPGNDHYLKHSPDRREESKEKEDMIETTKNTEEGSMLSNSGASPASKQTDKEQEEPNVIIKDENTAELSEKQSEVKESNINMVSTEKSAKLPPNCNIPVEIEVHITPAQLESTTEAEKVEETSPEATESLTPAQIESPEITDKVNDTLNDDKNCLAILEATESVTEPLILETISAELEDDLAAETFPDIDIPLSIDNESLAVQEDEAKDNTEQASNVDVESKFSQIAEPQQIVENVNDTIEESLKKHSEQMSETEFREVEINGNTSDVTKEISETKKEKVFKEHTKNISEEVSNQGAEINETTSVATTEILETKLETENKEESNEDKDSSLTSFETGPQQKQENGLDLNIESSVYMNGVEEVEEDGIHKNDEEVPLESMEDDQQNSQTTNGFMHSEVESLTNGSSALPDLVTELKSPNLQNGHVDVDPTSGSFTDMENGYDSIMSLPEPPPTTDEPLVSDLSDQQLDSLPPPPPPEIFNLKDLPPPLTNGNTVDSPQSEESNNFYNTLPPPPPTTLDVTSTETTTTPVSATTNGKVHASPLTPPASPPAHYTNNLHAGLCSQPIAVDVNGS